MKAVSVVLPAQVFKLFLSLALQIAIARTLLPEGRGVYGICVAIAAVLLVITYFGNEFGVRYLLVRKRITTSQAFVYLVVTATIAYLCAIAASWALNSFTFWLTERVTLVQLTLAVSLAFSQLLVTQTNVFMTIGGRYWSSSIFSVGEELIKLIAVITILFHFPTVETALLSAVMGNIIVIIVAVMRFKLYKKDYISLRMRDVMFIYRYGISAFLLNISSLTNAHLGTIVLSGLMPNQRVGLYNLAFALITKVQVFPDALNRVLVPASMANRDGQSRFEMVQLSVTALLAFSIVVIPLMGLLGTPVIIFLFGIEYIDVGPISVVLFAGFAFKIVGKPLEAHFNEIAGQPKVVAGIQIFSMVAMATLTFLGAFQFGLMGAAVGSALSMALSTIALFLAYAKATSRPVLGPISFAALFDQIQKLRV